MRGRPSICQNLHRLRSTSRQSRRPGPAPSRSPPGEDAAEDREVQGDLSSSNRSYPNELWQILDVYVGSQDERAKPMNGYGFDRLAPQTKSQTEPNNKSDHVSAVGRVPSRLTADNWESHH